jgi:hypothetical protein
MTLQKAKELLEVYSLTDIIEENDLTEEEVLVALSEQGLIQLPEVQPLEG